jgi:uncharacterized protein (TIGR00730 family)
MIRSVTVYCSSSREIKPAYLAAAHELGHAIASAGWTLVYGGNYLGSMAALADGARSANGTVVGITPRLMVGKGYDDKLCSELIVVDDMRQRKALLESRGDALVALPGGLGTLEELSEVIVGRVLKYHDKPIVILNIDGFYDPLLAFIEHGITEKFIKPKARDLYFVATSIPAAIAHLKRPHPGPGHRPPAATAPPPRVTAIDPS